MIQGYADHAANERTFLAWVRTGVAAIAFGFVIERFNLFLLSLQDAATLDPIRHSQLERLSGPSTHYKVSLLSSSALFCSSLQRRCHTNSSWPCAIWRSHLGLGSGSGFPCPECFVSEDAESVAGCEMALDVEGVEDRGVNREEALG
jgi:Domain of unknown function (DUF202)